MAINPLYVPLFNIEEVILDKDTGLPLSGGVVKFFRDSQRATNKTVYQISGTSPLYTFVPIGNEFTLGISGTFVDLNGNPFVPYAYPYAADGSVDLYWVTVESEGGVAQFTREAVPYLGSGGVAPSERSNTENELSNPQFVEVSFSTDSGAVTLNLTGSNTVTPIAPGWDLVTSGTGTVVLERLEPTAINIDTNPPYSLKLEASSGLGATITLRQRLMNSPSLLRGGYVSGFLLARVISGGATPISMTYAPSSGTATTVISSTNVSTDGAYHPIVGNASIIQQVNTAASTGYVDINIIIPTDRQIAITSLQVVGASYSIDVPFDEQSSARQKDHLFHYYENNLLTKPPINLLTGWNFPLNPYQISFTGTPTVTTQTTYVADQTILHQLAGATLKVAKAAITEGEGLQVTAITGTPNNQFALIQYIDPATIRPYWQNALSSMVRARLFRAVGSATTVRFKMRLIYSLSGLPAQISSTEPIASWASTDPTFSANWTAIVPLNDPVYTLPNSFATDGDGFPSFAFDRFELPVSNNVNMTLGIVIYTLDNLDDTVGEEESIIFDKVSLVPGLFAADAMPETFDESLRKCQYYYEHSYNVPQIPSTGIVTDNGQKFSLQTLFQNPGPWSYLASFDLQYEQVKRVAPTLRFYSPTSATAGLVEIGLFYNGVFPGASAGSNPSNIAIDPGVPNWVEVGKTQDRVTMYCNNTSTNIGQTGTGGGTSCILLWHYEADARLGV